jgi:PIN domain nuclease of toxin-antitoxin system
MRILLDTHTLLWWLGNDRRLPDAIGTAVNDGTNEILVSSISVAEISIKASLGKLQAPDDLLAQLRAASMISLPFTNDHAIALRQLPLHHRDPFDRMLVVQALTESLVFATVDPRCRQYAVQTLS